jgi:predicted RNase H-like HicB family nuclease
VSVQLGVKRLGDALQTVISCCFNLGDMVQALTFTARLEPVEDGWMQASIDELPGVITTGSSAEEAKEMLADALHIYLLALGDMEEGPDRPHRGDTEPLHITVNV